MYERTMGCLYYSWLYCVVLAEDASVLNTFLNLHLAVTALEYYCTLDFLFSDESHFGGVCVPPV